VKVVELLQGRRRWRVLDRPVIVVACPRSGSSLLFGVLAAHPRLWSWFGEAHDAWDVLPPPDHPAALGDSWPAAYATEEARRTAGRLLYRGALARRQRVGLRVTRLDRLGVRSVRFVEKTPKTCLRVAVVDRLFPDARFVFLHRDGPPNVASIVEAWERMEQGRAQVRTSSGREVTWSLARPAGWEDHVDEPVAAKAAFQWTACNRAALDGLAGVDPARVLRLSYESLLDDPEGWAGRLCRFAEVDLDPAVLRYARDLPHAPSTVSAPRPDKWREREAELAPVLPLLDPLMAELGYP
jgi:hypothetical protein